MERILIVLTTAPNEAVGAEIGRKLVEEGLAACVNMVPAVRSFYLWEGRLADEREVLLVAKVKASSFERYRLRMEELHPYDVPEIVAVAPEAVNPSYLAWCVGAG